MSGRIGRPTTDQQYSLDARALARDGALIPGGRAIWSWRSGFWVAIKAAGTEDFVTVTYEHRVGSSEAGRIELAVALDRTPCGWGGSRTWFLCPRCGRRVALLYLGRDGWFACRRCLGLAFRSQRETDEGRATRRLAAIRRRLGWRPGFLNGKGPKPTGMHWRTFERLTAKHDAAAAEVLGLMWDQLNRPRRLF